MKGTEKMKEFLFGWLTKPEILQTPLDEVMCVIEILILIFVIIPIGIEIMGKIEDFFDKGKERKMKKVIGIILIIVISLIILTGCTVEVESSSILEKRFVEVYSQWTTIPDVDDINIVYDKETKVQYIITDFYRGGAMTVLVDAEGKPVLYQGEN